MNDVLLKKWMQQVQAKSDAAIEGEAVPAANGTITAAAAAAPSGTMARAIAGVTAQDAAGAAADVATRRRVRLSRETRAQMLDRLTNPTISLHEASVLLDVCPATVRRYTNQGALAHERTGGGQRRFRLRPVLALMRELERKRKGR
jgi:transposase-like protein